MMWSPSVVASSIRPDGAMLRMLFGPLSQYFRITGIEDFLQNQNRNCNFGISVLFSHYRFLMLWTSERTKALRRLSSPTESCLSSGPRGREIGNHTQFRIMLLLVSSLSIETIWTKGRAIGSARCKFLSAKLP
jgi:hypothetical protein